MKRNTFSLVAVLLTVTVSSFTTLPITNFFLTYKGTGSPTQVASYNILTNQPRAMGTGNFNWMMISAFDENDIDDDMVSELITALNNVAGGSPHILSNEISDTPQLDVKL